MKSFIILIFLGGCASDAHLISQGKLYIGMSQNDLYKILILSDLDSDAFLLGCYREYVESTKINILASEKKEYFYIFENVDKPSLTCNQIGDGTLAMILNKLEFEIYNNSIKTSL